MVNCCTGKTFTLQRRRLQQLIDLVHHLLNPLAHAVALFVEGGDLAFDSIFFALSGFHLAYGSLDIALGRFCLRSKLLAQRGDFGLGCSACVSLAFYNLHCPQHFLLERLKLIHTDTGTHIRKYSAKQEMFGLAATVQNEASIE